MQQTTSWVLMLQTILLVLFFIALVRIWLMHQTERRRNSALWQHNDQLERDITDLNNRAAQQKPAKKVA